jgi:D-alanyl-D-alanine carboxypeptidase
MHRRLPLALAASAYVVAATTGLSAQESKSAPTPDVVAAKANEYLQSHVDVNGFSGSVLIGKGDQVLFAKGYGLANAEFNLNNTPQTKFRLGSITKQFTAMAIMILVEKGRLSLDDPISKYIENSPEAWKDVTIHHLLSHTGGVPSFTSLPTYNDSMPLPTTPTKTIDRVRTMKLEFKPGEKFNYSNTGYVMLGAIIEKVAGKTYEKFLEENVFTPLGMKDSGYDMPTKILANRASGFELRDGRLVHAPYLDMTVPHAAGALYSTVEDLHRWSTALDDGKLISPALAPKMYTPVKGNYAYGWAVGKRFGRQFVGHGGGIEGFQTDITRFPDERLCVVVLCNNNRSQPGAVATGLAAIALGAKYELPKKRKFVTVPAMILDRYVGDYQIAPGFVLSITRDGERLFGQATGQGKAELLAESESAFFVREANAVVTFVKDANGKITHLMLKQGALDTKANRVK